MNAYRKHSTENGTFTSQGYVLTGKRIEYETRKEHNGMALFLFAVPAVLLVGYILSTLA